MKGIDLVVDHNLAAGGSYALSTRMRCPWRRLGNCRCVSQETGTAVASSASASTTRPDRRRLRTPLGTRRLRSPKLQHAVASSIIVRSDPVPPSIRAHAARPASAHLTLRDRRVLPLHGSSAEVLSSGSGEQAVSHTPVATASSGISCPFPVDNEMHERATAMPSAAAQIERDRSKRLTVRMCASRHVTGAYPLRESRRTGCSRSDTLANPRSRSATTLPRRR